MMPAVKHFDPVMGVDIHILIVPMVGPVPIPHPHVAMIMDPMDYVPVIGSTVNVGVLPRGTAGTAGKSIPHIPMGAPFSKPPMNESEIFMGSAMVLADGSPMTFTALPVLSCHDIGMISPPRKKPKKTYGMVLPTSMVTAIPAGLPVLVGGPPTIDMMGMAMAGGMKALGGAFGKLRKLQKGSKRMKKVSDAIHKKAKKAMDKLGVPPSVQNKVHRGICSITGHPIDVAAGKMFTDAVDIELPGYFPFKWERVWFSTSVYDGPLGRGWHHNFDLALVVDEKAIAVRLEDGRSVAFPLLGVGEEAFQRSERVTLLRDSRGYALDTLDQKRFRFSNHEHVSGRHLLESITDKKSSSSLLFHYNSDGQLNEIVDSVGRFIRLKYNGQNKIVKILLPTPEHGSIDDFFTAVEYDYLDGDLISVKDALGHEAKFRYENHLLVQETFKDGLNFYFKYDGVDHSARCIETWGDGELYYRKLEYDTDANVTTVYDSKGAVTKYFHDGALPYQIENANGFVSRTEYNTYFQVICEIDEMGRKTQYEYDEYGNRIKEERPGGVVETFAYDLNNNLISRIDPMGGEWRYQYDANFRRTKEIDPLERERCFKYSDNGLIGITDFKGNHFSVSYDRYGNVVEVVDPKGKHVKAEYDVLGNALKHTDSISGERRFSYDAMGRCLKIYEADGNVRQYRYDAVGNVLEIKEENAHIYFS